MVPKDWVKLESSNISKVKFEQNKHDDCGNLFIEFNEGKVYKYPDVLAKKAEGLVHASSAHDYFRNHIRPYHKGVRE